jgi:hypothetical protein
MMSSIRNGYEAVAFMPCIDDWTGHDRKDVSGRIDPGASQPYAGISFGVHTPISVSPAA